MPECFLSSFLHQFCGSFYSRIKSERIVCITGEKFCFFLKFQKSNDEHQHLFTPFLQTEKIRIQTEQPKTPCSNSGELEHSGYCSFLARCFEDKPWQLAHHQECPSNMALAKQT